MLFLGPGVSTAGSPSQKAFCLLPFPSQTAPFFSGSPPSVSCPVPITQTPMHLGSEQLIMFQEVIDLEFPRCQRQSPAPALISQRNLPGPDGGCNWEPPLSPRDPWGVCPLHLGKSLDLHLLSATFIAWPSFSAENVGVQRAVCSGLGRQTGAQMSRAKTNGKCPSLPAKIWLVLKSFCPC